MINLQFSRTQQYLKQERLFLYALPMILILKYLLEFQDDHILAYRMCFQVHPRARALVEIAYDATGLLPSEKRKCFNNANNKKQ